MKAIDCPCGHTIKAEDEERLLAACWEHIRADECEPDPPFARLSDEQAREVVQSRSYELA